MRVGFLAALILLLARAWPAGAVLPAQDDFNRGTLGANWSQTSLVSAVGCTIASSTVLAAGGTSGSAGACLWNADVPTTASYACGQLANGAGVPSPFITENDAGVCLGVDDVSGGNGVCCTASPPAMNDEWNLYGFIMGGIVANISGTQAWSPGDYVGIQRMDATHFQCFRSTDGFTWTATSSIEAIPSIPDPGSLGAYAWSPDDDPFELTVWEGGNGVLPSDHVCGGGPSVTTTTSGPVTTTTTTTMLMTGPGIGKAPVMQSLSGVTKVPNGATWYQGVPCTQLDAAQPGYLTQCTNCLAGSDPAACGGNGCLVAYESGRWFCVGSGTGNLCSGCTPDPCLNGGVCVPDCAGGSPSCICPSGFTGSDCGTPVTTSTTTTTTTTTTTAAATTTTLPMPGCENVGDPCGSCDPAGICLSRCDGVSCAFICVQIIGSPCPGMDCDMAGPFAICVDATPLGCVDGVCDGNTACGFPCFGPTPSTTTTTTVTTTTVTTTIVTTTTTTASTTTGTGPTTTSTTVTTTTTTTTTTVTTTTTSTTTTTTIVDSVTFLWMPAPPMEASNVAVASANLLTCSAWTPTLGILHATSLSFDMTCPGPDVNFSISIYSGDGSSRTTTTGQVACTFNGNYVINAGDFSLDAGTEYQVCACGGATNANFLSANTGPSNVVSNLAQSISGGELRTTGANPCIDGAPPLTTGALTPVLHNLMPIVLIGTNTP